MSGTRQNWSRTVDYGFETVHEPADLEQVRQVVTSARRLRPVGTGHTFNRLPDGEAAISLRGLRDVEVEGAGDGASVRVGAGLSYADLAEALRPHGLALENLASLPHINVVGAVSTATHGSGQDARNLASSVREIELVTAGGEVLTVRRGDEGDVPFDGAVVGLGSLGVVTSLVLDTVPARDYRQVVLTGVAEDEIGPRLDEITHLGRSVSVFTLWDGAPARIWVKSREDDPHVDAAWPEADVDHHPLPGLDPVNCTPQRGVPGWWADRIPHFRTGFLPSSGDEVQSEWHVALEHGPAAVEALREAGPRLAPALLTSEIRSVAADELWLSPQHHRATRSFHFTWVGDNGLADDAARVVEEALAPFDARPHWGKVFHADVTGLYPRLGDFRALRERLDPGGTFLNPWLERVLLGGR